MASSTVWGVLNSLEFELANALRQADETHFTTSPAKLLRSLGISFSATGALPFSLTPCFSKVFRQARCVQLRFPVRWQTAEAVLTSRFLKTPR